MGSHFDPRGEIKNRHFNIFNAASNLRLQVESVLEKSRALGEDGSEEGPQQPERSPSKVTFSEEDQVGGQCYDHEFSANFASFRRENRRSL
jgi:hypothetical protein